MASKIYNDNKIWDTSAQTKQSESDFNTQLKKLTNKYGVSTENEDKKEMDRLKPTINTLINNL
jgi:hypothetical protein